MCLFFIHGAAVFRKSDVKLNMKLHTLLMLLTLALSSCWGLYGKKPEPIPDKVLGYKPVYSQDSSLRRIYTDAPKQVKNAGKIYAIGNLVLQNEVGLGLHVIDRTDPANLQNLGFIHIPGNTEVSIKGTHLYANSYGDLVVVDVSNWQTAREIKRINHAFQQTMLYNYGYTIPPPERNVYYDCSYNSSSGVQTGWVKDSIPGYSCFYR